MRQLRRISLRTLLFLVAASGVILGWVRSEMSKPYPTGFTVMTVNGSYPRTVIQWSDHKPHEVERRWGVSPTGVQFGWIITRIRWSDDSTTRHFHWPER